MAKLIDITGKALAGEWGSDDETGNGVPVLRTTNFTNTGVVDYNNVVTRTITKKKIEEKYLRKGDIIIEKSGGSDKQPVGRVIYFDGPDNTYLFNNFTGLLRVKNQEIWYPRYVFYSLFSNYRRGGTRPYENKTTGLHNLKTDDYVSRYEVSETDMATQIQICDRLDRMYGIIKMRQQELQKLDELIKARFVEMFDGKYPEDTLLHLCNIIDYRGKTPEKVESGLPFITAKNVKMHYMTLEPREYISKETYDKVMVRGFPKEGDVVFTTEAPLGNVCRIPHFDTEFYIGQRIVTMQTEALNPIYLEYALSDDEFVRKYMSKSSGSTVTGIRVRLLEQLTIPVPPRALQDEFASFVKQVDKSKVVVQKALDETQLLFDSLMQEYFG
ncbi:MAG: restriction endonuclease subunit S [Clostridiales bacterium]|nr:restriction endonuclease subunit S [Candidatus Crickella caballi]